ncbi:predicted protein [Naegleria gruberi]|uniref:Predicted protein n=1 Tax=Naegleria gruberi TaxID=5762 RepID=D2V3S8_NAEGR|nr:uncharacterized protein NAEGRDRAFT_63475 [Naegleria gruberi]EFC48406.1 predicted protein [Naegleria gruberi]|eukprot:XP_002681150.1 predicted protein [Naegleria gruberi strain NEG-M]
MQSIATFPLIDIVYSLLETANTLQSNSSSSNSNGTIDSNYVFPNNNTSLATYSTGQNVMTLIVDGVSLPTFSILLAFKIISYLVQWVKNVKNKRLFQAVAIGLAALQLFGSTTGIASATSNLAQKNQAVGKTLQMLNYECIVLSASLFFLSQCVISIKLHELYYNPKRYWMQGKEGEQKATQSKLVKYYTWFATGCEIFMMCLLVPAIIICLSVPFSSSVDAERAYQASYGIFYASIAVAGVTLILSFITGIVNLILSNRLRNELLNSHYGKITKKRKTAAKYIPVVIVVQTVLAQLIVIMLILASVSIFVDSFLFIAAYTVQRAVIFGFTAALKYIYKPLEQMEDKLGDDINHEKEPGCFGKLLMKIGNFLSCCGSMKSCFDEKPDEGDDEQVETKGSSKKKDEELKNV